MVSRRKRDWAALGVAPKAVIHLQSTQTTRVETGIGSEMSILESERRLRSTPPVPLSSSCVAPLTAVPLPTFLLRQSDPGFNCGAPPPPEPNDVYSDSTRLHVLSS